MTEPLVFVIRCGKCKQFDTRTVYTSLRGKAHICPNCRRRMTIKYAKNDFLSGNTGRVANHDEAMILIAAMKEKDALNSPKGFVTPEVNT